MSTKRTGATYKGKVIVLDGPTTLALPPDRVLKSAVGKLDQVVLIGLDKDGDPYYATSIGRENGGLAQVNLKVDQFKQFLLDQLDT